MKQAIFAMGLVCAAGTVQAQDIYLGGTLDYLKPHSGSEHTAVGLMGGATVWDDGQLSFAAQGEYNSPMAASSKPDAARLRALASYDFGAFSGVGGLGVTRYSDAGDTYSGINVSLGADFQLQSGPTTLRVELIRDWMDGYGADVTTTRVGYYYNF